VRPVDGLEGLYVTKHGTQYRGLDAEPQIAAADVDSRSLIMTAESMQP
jgi:hypothetical protein